MTVLFNSGPVPGDPQLADLWELLAGEAFAEALALAEAVCQNPNAPIEYFCGLSLAYGELGDDAAAEQVARLAVGFGEGHWRARHALAVSLLHQGRFLGAVDTLGFYRSPAEIYVIRAQAEKMGGFAEGLRETLEDALDQDVPPAVQLCLPFLYATLDEEVPEWTGRAAGLVEMRRWGDHLDAWERDVARHAPTPYGEHLGQQIAVMRRMLGRR